MDAQQEVINKKRKGSTIVDEPPIEEIFTEVAAESDYSPEEIEKTRATLFSELRIHSRDAMLLFASTPFGAQMSDKLMVGLFLEFINKLKNFGKSKGQPPRKRAKYGPQQGNATTLAELADKILEDFHYKEMLDDILPNRKADYEVISLEAVSCKICDITIKLGYPACPSKFLRHLYGKNAGTVTAHMNRVIHKKKNVKAQQSSRQQAEVLRTLLSLSTGRVACLCGEEAAEANIAGAVFYVCAKPQEARDRCSLKKAKRSAELQVDEGIKQRKISLLKKSKSRQIDTSAKPQGSNFPPKWRLLVQVHVLKTRIAFLEKRLAKQNVQISSSEQVSIEAQVLNIVEHLLQSSELTEKVWTFIDTLLNYFRGKGGQRYHHSTRVVGKKIKMRGGSASLSLLPLPCKSTLSASKPSYLHEYGVSKTLVELAKRYYEQQKLPTSTNFLICLDGIYVPEDDNLCFLSRTRHGFVIPDNSTVLRINSYTEVEKPFVEKWKYARQVVVVLLCPLVPGYRAFPIGLLPTEVSYDAKLTKSLFDRAVAEAQAQSFTVLAISADNAPGHAAYFSDQVNLQPFVLVDWPYGAPIDQPVPLVDYLHVGRKLCNQVINSKRVIMIGEVPVIIQPLLDLQHVIEGFNVRVMKHQDAQYQQRVDFLLGNSQLHSRLGTKQSAEGLVVYLQMMQYFYFAFASKTWSWKQRIYAGWQSVCFLVYTRQFVIEHRDYTLAVNHITTPTFVAVLLTVTSLVACCQRWSSQIAPWLLYEYWCENFFSSVRSWIINKSSVTVSKLWHIVNEIVELIESPQKLPLTDLPTDQLTTVEILAVLAGADFEVRQILGQEQYGMTNMLSKYHGVVACLKQEASINSAVLMTNQIPTRIEINLEVTTVAKSPSRTRHMNQDEKVRYQERFGQQCGDWIPFSKLLSLFGAAKRNNQSFSRDRERRPIMNRITTPIYDNSIPKLSINKAYVFINVKDEDPTSYYGTIVQIVTVVNSLHTVVPEAPISDIKYLIMKAELLADADDSEQRFPLQYSTITNFDEWKILRLKDVLAETSQIRTSDCC